MRLELSKEYINGKYPDAPPEEMVRVDLVDDGEMLESFESNSQDFVPDRAEFIYIVRKV